MPGQAAGPDGGRPHGGWLRNLAGRAGSSLHSLASSSFHTLVDDLVTTAFPSDCRICSRPLLRSTHLPLCDLCRAAVLPQADTLCRQCGEALDLDLESVRLAAQLPAEGLLCYACRAVPPLFERAVAYAVYQDELREMIHLLKYERMRVIANLLGGMLAEAILMLHAEAAPQLTVVAVPLFRSRQNQRGYNQSELLADAAIARLRLLAPEWQLARIPGLLTRRRDTRSQFELNPRGRRKNMEGAFEADAACLTPGCEVLLIDDIYTTGATARECARVLRRAGARKVWVATLARAQAPRIALWENPVAHAAQGFG